MLYKLDESVGKVVQELKENNMLQDSIIVFTTDNGGPASGFNQNAASNFPLKGVRMIQLTYNDIFTVSGGKSKKILGVIEGQGLQGQRVLFDFIIAPIP